VSPDTSAFKGFGSKLNDCDLSGRPAILGFLPPQIFGVATREQTPQTTCGRSEDFPGIEILRVPGDAGDVLLDALHSGTRG
jgi:hypothetical protein